MEVHEAIRKRRSVRKFTGEPVSGDDLKRVLEAAQWAPSWANVQPWRIVIVTETKKKEALAGALFPANPAAKGVIQAPVVLVLIAERGKSGFYGKTLITDKGEWYMFDLGLAAQNIVLAAHALGLGTVHVGAMNSGKAAEILGIPGGFEVVEILPLGHPAYEPKAPPRKPLAEFVTWESFKGDVWSEGAS